MRDLHMLRRLQTELFADDIAIDEQVMLEWTEVQCRAFFETGGMERPILPGPTKLPVSPRQSPSPSSLAPVQPQPSLSERPPPLPQPPPSPAQAQQTHDDDHRPMDQPLLKALSSAEQLRPLRSSGRAPTTPSAAEDIAALELCLSDIGLRAPDAVRIAGGFCSSKQLRRLDLSHNGLGVDGVCTIARELATLFGAGFDHS